MKPSDYITSIEEASRMLDWDPKSIRAAAREGKLSFATAIKGSGKNYVYHVDKNALLKCVRGEKDLFRS